MQLETTYLYNPDGKTNLPGQRANFRSIGAFGANIMVCMDGKENRKQRYSAYHGLFSVFHPFF